MKPDGQVTRITRAQRRFLQDLRGLPFGLARDCLSKPEIDMAERLRGRGLVRYERDDKVTLGESFYRITEAGRAHV